MSKFLKAKGQFIVDGKGKNVFLRGVNLGGWLMPEGYFMMAPNRGYHIFQKNFVKHCGQAALEQLEKSFRDNWIKEKDIEAVAKLGANVMRVPFHHKLIETEPYTYDLEGVAYLDKVIRWAKKYGIWVILDFHAAPGGQSCDWHCDSDGRARLWTSNAYQKRTAALWAFLADRYRNNETVAGYDILNESVHSDTKQLNDLYRRIIKAIRQVDRNHILFVEGNNWAIDLDCLDVIEDDNVCLSIHYYEPLDYSFNFVPNMTYPLPGWKKAQTKKLLTERVAAAKKRNRPVFVGEFGVCTRGDQFGESKYLEDVLQCFEELNLHWTYWTYKAVKNFMFPDGLWSYYPNVPWVNRHGPLTGWDTWHLHWPTQSKQMIQSWQTDQFSPNNEVVKVLKQYL